jgi:hypothetical protein
MEMARTGPSGMDPASLPGLAGVAMAEAVGCATVVEVRVARNSP